MQLPEVCIRRPVLASMMNLGLMLAGLICLFRLPVRELPDIDPPIVNVTTVYPGANSSVVETEVTERLEDAINSVEGIKNITSESREQLSSITVEFSLARDIDLAAQDVRDRVARVQGRLPDDAEAPIVAKQDSDARPMLWIALYSDLYSTRELTEIGDRYLKDALQSLPGVSSIFFGGEKRFAVRIRLDSEKMAARGITVLDIERALREQNVELPSGRVENRERELVIKTLGELKTPDEFNKLVVGVQGGSFVRLRDVGWAEIGVEDERSIARYNSKPAVGLGIVKQAKANTIAVSDAVKQELKERKPSLPEGVEAFVAYNESTFVEKSIRQVWHTLFAAFLLVIVTIFVFLRSVRSTIIPALTIPVACITTFAVLALMGYSVNILTMLGLVLAIGVVVDDSIVVLENIYRHIEEGESPMQAAFAGMKEITFAVIATTVALVAVFLPLAFQTTITGRLFIEFAVALSGAVIISSFVALSLTPMVSSRILKPPEASKKGGFFDMFERFFEGLSSRYVKRLEWCLSHRKIVICGIGVVAAATVFFYFRLEQEFLPEEDKGRLFAISITPEGSTVEYTNKMVRRMEEIIRSVPETEGYFSATALARGGPGRANEGLMFVRFREKRSRRVQDLMQGPNGLMARFIGGIEGAFAIPIMPKAIGGGFSQTFKLVLQHQEIERLNKVTKEIVQALQAGGYLVNVRSSFELNKAELRVHIDRDRAAALGVSIRDIARTLQILFGGQDLSHVKLEGEEYDVIVQLARKSRLMPKDIERLYIRSAGGDLVQLSNVVSYEVRAGPNAINHYNRFRSASIEGTPAGLPLGTVVERVEKLLQEKLPSDFRYEWSGEAEDLIETGESTAFVIIVALLVIYMVLAAQFESLIHPITVMAALPLGAFGALGGLWLLSGVNNLGEGLYGWSHYAPDPPAIAAILSSLVPRIPAMTVNLFSEVGMVLLFGLVTKNSILLVDFANQAMRRGKSAEEAVLEAGRIRLRPILMTAFATIAGILPIAFGLGAGAESRRPMGVAVVFGMGTSTFLTLFAVPVIYTLFSDLFSKRRVEGDA